MTARRGKGAAVVLLGMLAFGFVAAAIYFACLQNVWVDETTQLSGITLPPARLFAWLAGAPEPTFGVPPDRAPPLSYLIDAACERTLCETPFSFRMLHLAAVIIGMGVLLVTMARRHGSWAALVSAAVLFLSPKMIVTAVEIRAYPLFLAIACVQVALLVQLTATMRLRTWRLGLFAGAGVLACYTHFFGMVATAALFGGLFAARARTVREAATIGGVGIAVLVLAAGLFPFVTGASAISGNPTPAASLSALAGFPLKLMTDIYVMLIGPVAALMLLAFAALIVVAAIQAVRALMLAPTAPWRSPEIALLIALFLGMGVTVLASFRPLGFDPLATGYSIWTFPILAWLAGAACAGPRSVDGNRVLLRAGSAAAIVFALASSAATGAFLRHASWFVHGPDVAIAASVGLRPDKVAVIQRGSWALAYYPTVYRYHGRVAQWFAAPDGTLHRLVAGRPDPASVGAAALAGYRRVVLVDTEPRGYLALRQLLRNPRAAVLVPAPPPPALAAAGFARSSPREVPGLYWAALTTFERLRPSTVSAQR